jgi:hypothetical protein
MKKQILSIAFGVVTMAIGTTTYAANKIPVSNTKFTATEKHGKCKCGANKKAVDAVFILPTDGFFLYSEVNGNKVTSAYDKNGKWVYTIERHTATSLLKDVMDIVRESYYNYYISGMEKIEIPGFDAVYIVHIGDENSIKTLRVSNGEVELIQDFDRA